MDQRERVADTDQPPTPPPKTPVATTQQAASATVTTTTSPTHASPVAGGVSSARPPLLPSGSPKLGMSTLPATSPTATTATGTTASTVAHVSPTTQTSTSATATTTSSAVASQGAPPQASSRTSSLQPSPSRLAGLQTSFMNALFGPPAPQRLVAESCLDFLHIEMVSLLLKLAKRERRRDARLAARLTGLAQSTSTSGAAQNGPQNAPMSAQMSAVGEEDYFDYNYFPSDDEDDDEEVEPQKGSGKSTTSSKSPAVDAVLMDRDGVPFYSPGADGDAGENSDDLADREVVYTRLELIGYRVGQRLVERYTKDRPRFGDALDIIKYMCKDFWILLFRKQVDNLKTNHKGVFVLQDNAFKWLSKVSSDQSGGDILRESYPYLAFPCGVTRGALANLGLTSVVAADMSNLPQCTFKIELQTAGR